MFNEIKKICPEADPTRMMLDFEPAVREPAKRIMGVRIAKGCNFHFRQATLKRRRTKEPALQKAYYEYGCVREVVDMLDGLAFVPPDDVKAGKLY